MKKILMSIFMVLLLAFSMLGSVIAEGEIEITDLSEPATVVMGTTNEVQIEFSVTNNHNEDLEIVHVFVDNPESGGVELNTNFGEFRELSINQGESERIEFRVTIPGDIQRGLYEGEIIVATNIGGDIVEDTKDFQITLIIPNEAPIANINAPTESTFVVGERINFEGIGVDNDEDEIDSYEWNFGDNGVSIMQNPTHSYNEVGSYDVTLRVKDDRLAIWSEPAKWSELVTKTIRVEVENPILKLYEEDEEILVEDEITLSGAEETTVEEVYRVWNKGNVNLDDMKISFTGDFTDEDNNRVRLYVNGDEIALDHLYNLNDMAKNSYQELTLRAVIPEDMEIDNYKGIITITGDSAFSGEDVTYTNENFEVIIEPKTCKDGVIGDLRINDFDVEEDNLDIGDVLEGDIEVENRHNDDDRDTVVEVMLYNLNENEEIIDWTVIGEENIEEDESEDFSFELDIPYHEDINKGDTYILYVKAFEDGDEDEQCTYDSIEIDIDRNDDEVIVNRFTVLPTVASQGDLVSFSIGVENVGLDDQDDTYITVINTELGLNLESIKFDLDKYSKNDNDMIKTLTFAIPRDAEAKEYTIEARVYFKNGREYNTAFGKLTVEGEATVDTNEGNTEGDITTETTGAGTYTLTGNSVLGSLGSTKTLFIIGDIVLVILAVLFLILIFRRK